MFRRMVYLGILLSMSQSLLGLSGCAKRSVTSSSSSPPTAAPPQWRKIAEWKGGSTAEDHEIKVTSNGEWYLYYVVGGDVPAFEAGPSAPLPPRFMIRGTGKDASKNVDFFVSVDGSNGPLDERHLYGNGADMLAFDQTGTFHVYVKSTGKWGVMVVARQ